MSGLTTRFGNFTSIMQDRPLTGSQIMNVAPSIFAEEKHESRSLRYTYIPTIEVLNGLRKEGFQPFQVVQSRTRDESRQDFTKHMLRLRHVDQISKSEANEIILVNSHDGTSSYQMLAGCFRFVCQNGMVCGDTLEDVRIPHRGSIINNVIEAAYRIIEDFDIIDQSKDTMKTTFLTKPEEVLFAQAALPLKYDDIEAAPIDAKQLLTARRYDDHKNDLWTTFNRVQENIIRGGLHGLSATGNKISTRAVNSIDNNIKLNKALWTLAEGMAVLKAQ